MHCLLCLILQTFYLFIFFTGTENTIIIESCSKITIKIEDNFEFFIVVYKLGDVTDISTREYRYFDILGISL